MPIPGPSRGERRGGVDTRHWPLARFPAPVPTARTPAPHALCPSRKALDGSCASRRGQPPRDSRRRRLTASGTAQGVFPRGVTRRGRHTGGRPAFRGNVPLPRRPLSPSPPRPPLLSPSPTRLGRVQYSGAPLPFWHAHCPHDARLRPPPSGQSRPPLGPGGRRLAGGRGGEVGVVRCGGRRRFGVPPTRLQRGARVTGVRLPRTSILPTRPLREAYR